MTFILDFFLKSIFIFSLCTFLYAEEKPLTVNFKSVPADELVRYVSHLSRTNFIYNDKDLAFPVSLVSSKPCSHDELLQMLIVLLKEHHLAVRSQEGNYIIYKSRQTSEIEPIKQEPKKEFFLHKLQYHSGESFAKELACHEPGASLQWIESSNSLLCSGTKQELTHLQNLITALDQPRKQVFIEVLVLETDVKEGLEFGLQWSAGSAFRNKGNFGSSTLPELSPPKAFQLGIIGDLLLYKGSIHLSLNSLVSALEQTHKSTIVLNQKILSQDHRSSKIFVGDNVPFAGSYVQTVGNAQQTTANIEYRDIGVLLEITPLLGEEDTITLQIHQEITEASPQLEREGSLSGIHTTKTNMTTSVHVPDRHFLVLSGMMQSSKREGSSGLPCLGSLPWIGSLFAQKTQSSEKRNILIFVCPQIIHKPEKNRSPDLLTE